MRSRRPPVGTFLHNKFHRCNIKPLAVPQFPHTCSSINKFKLASANSDFLFAPLGMYTLIRNLN